MKGTSPFSVCRTCRRMFATSSPPWNTLATRSLPRLHLSISHSTIPRAAHPACCAWSYCRSRTSSGHGPPQVTDLLRSRTSSIQRLTDLLRRRLRRRLGRCNRRRRDSLQSAAASTSPVGVGSGRRWSRRTSKVRSLTARGPLLSFIPLPHRPQRHVPLANCTLPP